MWARSAEVAQQINDEHLNNRYLPDFPLPPSLTASHDLAEVAECSDITIMAVPSHGFRQTLVALAPYQRPWTPVVSLVKGLEQVTNKRMTEIVAEVLPGHPAGVLAGPNIAREVVAGYAAAAVIAMPDQHLAAQLQELFRTKFFRIYSTSDVTGVEIAGALKNVFAIAVGMGDGIGAGDNTKAMIITRSLREMSKLGEKLGGERETFAGLAGMGDLIATAGSHLSRNHRLGEELAKGRTWAEIEATLPGTAEGAYTVRAALGLAERHGVDMPIAREVARALFEGKSVQRCMVDLLARESKDELADYGRWVERLEAEGEV